MAFIHSDPDPVISVQHDGQPLVTLMGTGWILRSTRSPTQTAVQLVAQHESHPVDIVLHSAVADSAWNTAGPVGLRREAAAR